MIIHGLIFFYGYTKLKSSSNDLRNESWSLKNYHYFWSIESQMDTVVLHGRSALGDLPAGSHSVRMSIHVCETPDWWPAVAHSCLRQIPGAATAMNEILFYYVNRISIHDRSRTLNAHGATYWASRTSGKSCPAVSLQFNNTKQVQLVREATVRTMPYTENRSTSCSSGNHI